MATASMSTAKRTLLEAGVGLALGFAAACAFLPTVISKWYQPLSQNAFSCAGTVEEALTLFVRYMLGAAVGGALLVTGGLFFIRRKLGGNKQPAAPAA
jgi:hypothetical protein